MNINTIIRELRKNADVKVFDNEQQFYQERREIIKYNNFFKYKGIFLLVNGDIIQKRIIFNLDKSTIDQTYKLFKADYDEIIFCSKIKHDIFQVFEKYKNINGMHIFRTKLKENDITYIINKLTDIKTISFVNSINKIPKEIVKLKSLQSLDLRYNNLEEIPEFIGDLKGLQHLELSNNNLKEVPEAIGKLKGLQSIYLSGNNLDEIPVFIGNIKGLERIDLSKNNIKEIPEFIGNLNGLQRLDLSSNNLKEIPGFIENLNGLQRLDISGNDLEEIPEFIGNLKGLQRLCLSGNNLKEIPKFIGNLKNLKSLYASSNSLKEIPEFIGELKGLQRLYLSGNDLEEIPEFIENLKELQRLYLSGNNISNLSAKLFDLEHLKVLSINGNPLVEPPIEIAKQGINAIREYFKAKSKDKTVKVYEAKLMIVGEPGAGKTSLRLKLKHPEAPLPNEEKTTRGIDIDVWKFFYDGNQYSVNLWDFGGQQIYNSIHQFFMSERVLYVLLADSRKEDTDYFDWLYRIELFAGESPVVIVHNEKDDRKREINMSQIAKRFPKLPEPLRFNLAKIIGTNREKDYNFVKKRLMQEISNLDVIGQEFPKSWIELRAKLEEIVKEENLNYISSERYYNICKEEYNIKRSAALILGNYLHAIGAILFFPEDPVLKQIVILSPEWGTSAVYKVVDDYDVQNDNGLFNRIDMKRIWQDSVYDDKHDELLRLMENFGVCYEILNSKGKYILPQLLPYQPQDYKWNEKDNLYFEYRYPDYYLKDIMVRFIISVHELIENQKTVWRNGVILEDNGTRAEVIADENKRVIHIRVSGTFRRDLLSVIRKELFKIHRKYQKLIVKQMVPCNCEVCKKTDEPTLYNYEKLRKRLEDKQYTIECDKEYMQVKIADLINDIGANDVTEEKCDIAGNTDSGNKKNGNEVKDTEETENKKWWQKASEWFKSFGEIARALISIILLILIVITILGAVDLMSESQIIQDIIDKIGGLT